MTIIYAIPAVRDAWADQAVPVTDIVDPGNAFVAAGWLQSTSPPPRAYFNWALNWASNAIRYFMQNGIVDWQVGELYQQDSVVVFNHFVFQSLANNNSGNNPSTATTFWGPLAGYATIASLTAYVTAAQLAVDLSAFAAKDSPTLTGLPLAPTAPANTSNNQLATTAFAVAAAAAAQAAAIAQAALFSANASNLNSGFVANARLPNIGSMPGVVIAADPGTTPVGNPGQMFFYF
jgi:hypothetical protein